MVCSRAAIGGLEQEHGPGVDLSPVFPGSPDSHGGPPNGDRVSEVVAIDGSRIRNRLQLRAGHHIENECLTGPIRVGAVAACTDDNEVAVQRHRVTEIRESQRLRVWKGMDERAGQGVEHVSRPGIGGSRIVVVSAHQHATAGNGNGKSEIVECESDSG